MVDFRDIIGQDHVKRGLEVAAAGGHSVVLIGEPGVGKTLLALAFRALLPEGVNYTILDNVTPGSVYGTRPVDPDQPEQAAFCEASQGPTDRRGGERPHAAGSRAR